MDSHPGQQGPFHDLDYTGVSAGDLSSMMAYWRSDDLESDDGERVVDTAAWIDPVEDEESEDEEDEEDAENNVGEDDAEDASDGEPEGEGDNGEEAPAVADETEEDHFAVVDDLPNSIVMNDIAAHLKRKRDGDSDEEGGSKRNRMVV